MRSLIAAPLLGLTLLGGCAEPQYLLTERTDSAPLATTSSLRDVPARYTHHAVGAIAPTKVVTLRIDANFTAEDQAKINAAIREWNHVLNGAARFEVATASGPVDWTIAMSPLGVLPSEYDNPQALASNLRTGKNSGIIIVYANRIKDPRLYAYRNHDMRGVMVSELGNALGGGNGSSLYTAHVQDCVDRNMAMSVGSVLQIPASRLNWCENGTTVAAL